MAISHVFDPFAAMLDWLLAIAGGEDARLTINEEGFFSHLDVTAGASSGLVRLTVRGDPAWNARPVVVVAYAQVGRGALLQGFRAGLAHVWDKPDRETFWDRWVWYGYPEWREDFPEWRGPPVSWERLDAALGHP